MITFCSLQGEWESNIAMFPEDVDILVTLGVERPKEAPLPSFGTGLSIRAAKWCIGLGGRRCGCGAGWAC